MKSTFITTFIARGITATGSVILILWLGRIISTENLGKFIFYYTLVSISSAISRFGLETTLMKNASKYWPDKKNESKIIIIQYSYIVIFISIILSLFIYITLSFFSEFTRITIGYNSIVILTFSILLFSLNSMIASALKSSGKPDVSPIFESGGSDFILFILTIVVYFFTKSLSVKCLQILYLSSLSFVFLCGLFILYRLYEFNLWNIKNIGFKEKLDLSILKNSYNFFLINLIVLVSGRGIPFIIGLGSPPVTVGIFSLLQTISSIVGFSLLVYSSILPPKFSNLYSNKKLFELKFLFDNSKKNLILMSLPVAGLILVLYKKVFITLNIVDNYENFLSLLLLLLAQIVIVWNGPSGFLLIMCDHEKFAMKTTIVTYLIMLMVLITTNMSGGSLFHSTIIIAFGLSTRSILLALARKKIWKGV